MKTLLYPVALALSGAGLMFLPMLGMTVYAIGTGRQATLRILLFLWVAMVFFGSRRRKRGTPLD